MKTEGLKSLAQKRLASRLIVFGLCLRCADGGFCAIQRDQEGSPAEPTLSSNLEFFSPAAVVCTQDSNTVFIACATTKQVIRYDLTHGLIERSMSVPTSPSGLTLSADARRLYVSCAAPESSLCVLDASSGKIVASVPAGHTAMSPVLSKDEKTVFLCERFNDAIDFVDIKSKKRTARVQVEREPVAAALTPDGRYLFVANLIHAGRSDKGVVAASVTVIDVAERKVVKQIPLTNGSTLLHGLCISPDGRYVAVAHTLARFHLPTTHVTLGWMNDNVISLIDVGELKLLNTVLLDDLEQGAANPWGIGWTSDGKLICVTHAGTHELSVVDADALLEKLARLPLRLEGARDTRFLAAAQTKADVPNDLRFLQGLRRRIKLPGNGPRALALTGHTAIVGCFFSDSLVIVDADRTNSPAVVMPLHATGDLPGTRRGEMYFNDGTLCYQGWQSCASCHSEDGRVDGMNWDLQNDGIGNPKNVKSLLLSFQTPPVMSMGVRADAATAIRAGIRYILFADLPQKYAAGMDEYVKSLKPIASPLLVHGRLSADAKRGKRLFFDAAVGCANCHKPPLFTDLKPHEVGTGKFDESSDQFYTPTLIELWRTAPYLHDGSAATVREAMTIHNRQNRRGQTSNLTAEQIDDLATYVLSL
ncbi:MAG TPA: c-type cytochrome [Candidatus Limnocylindrales bacterium]|jgi:DNA-binding beta-propeller fold protein YncE|nr:c-type cytochrome [Candidatus Limnocylindrales bacterium]